MFENHQLTSQQVIYLDEFVIIRLLWDAMEMESIAWLEWFHRYIFLLFFLNRGEMQSHEI